MANNKITGPNAGGPRQLPIPTPLAALVDTGVRTKRMAGQITPRAKRLLVIAMVTPWLFLIVYYGAPMLNSQRRHLNAIEDHIAAIGQQWDRFRAEHPGFQGVKLFAYTGGDGMFGANGYVATDEEIVELRKFMQSTSPPRPIYSESVRVVGPEFFELQKGSEPVGPSSRSQPIRPETDRTPSAAGSRR